MKAEHDLPLIVDANQAAELFHCKKSTIETLASTGKIPGTKIGQGWIFMSAMLIDWLEKEILDSSEKRKTPSLSLKGKRRKPPPSLTEINQR